MIKLYISFYRIFMPKNKSIFEDINKLASSTFTTMVNLKNEVSQMVKDQMKTSIKSMDFVSKSDFDALKKVVNNMDKELKKVQAECQHCRHMLGEKCSEPKAAKATPSKKEMGAAKPAKKSSAKKSTK